MDKKRRHTNAHETTIPALYRLLKSEFPEDHIWINSRWRTKHRPVPETNIYPDVVNGTQRIAYEVHWKGERKEDNFQELPPGCRGVNVFIVDIWQTDDVYVMTLDHRYTHISREDWAAVP